MELYSGRPVDEAGRLPRELRVYDYLDRLDIPYQRTDHERADTMEACNQIDRILNVVICKNLFLCNRQKTSFYLLMMPGDRKFKTKELSSQIQSSRLSFAEPSDMLRYLDIEPGAVSVMGLMNDTDHAVQLLIEEDSNRSPSGKNKQKNEARNCRRKYHRQSKYAIKHRLCAVILFYYLPCGP